MIITFNFVMEFFCMLLLLEVWTIKDTILPS